MRQLDDKTFSGAISDHDMVMVMFSAPWSGPCNIARDAFDATAQRFGNTVDFYVFDIDDNTVEPEKLGLRMVPSFYLFDSGQVVDVVAGAVPSQRLVDMLESAL